MRRKSDISWRIGMVMLLLGAALVMTVLPASADYEGDHNLTEKYSKGTVTGGMNYTIGNSTYSEKMWSYNLNTYYAGLAPTFPDNSETSIARLYVYWTYSFNNTNSSYYDVGVVPTMTVKFGPNTLTNPEVYYDTKDEAHLGEQYPTFNFPSGINAYDVTNYVNASNSGTTYVVNVTNSKPYAGDDYTTTGDDRESFNIQAIGLLTLYNKTSNQKNFEYWVDEGTDLTYLKANSTDIPPGWKDNREPEDTWTWANFTGVDVTNASSVDSTLVTVAPSAGTPYNKLFFSKVSAPALEGLWDGDPRDKDFSWDDFLWVSRDVKTFFEDGNNSVKFQNGLNYLDYRNDTQMQAANAFLLLNMSSS